MIWYNKTPNLTELNSFAKNTLAEHLNIEIINIGPDSMTAKMPVLPQTHQPFGLLHGGASAALAETLGSLASLMCLNNEKQTCVGIELNCNHIRGKKDGYVIATATPFHLGGSTHVWQIKIEDETGKLICISRLTTAIIKNLKKS